MSTWTESKWNVRLDGSDHRYPQQFASLLSVNCHESWKRKWIAFPLPCLRSNLQRLADPKTIVPRLPCYLTRKYVGKIWVRIFESERNWFGVEVNSADWYLSPDLCYTYIHILNVLAKQNKKEFDGINVTSVKMYYLI